MAMHIHWFPGHMTKALRMMEESVRLVDVVVYVLDARIPASCTNPSFDAIVEGKSILYVLNKADIADEAKTRIWLEKMKNDGLTAIAVNGSESRSAKQLLAALKTIKKPKAERFESKGAVIPVRVMVIGVPNSGKSTIINTLSGRKQTATGDKPGVTRGKQWVRLDSGIELLDTPGTLFPNFSDQKKAARLAFVGSVKDAVVDTYELALELLAEIHAQYPKSLAEKYGITTQEKPQEMLEQVCRRRGFVLKGNELDIERGADAVIDDFRKARIARMTLELPDETSKI